VADKKEAKREFGIELVGMEEVQEADCLIFLVAHKQFKELRMAEIDALYNKQSTSKKVIIDVKSIFAADTFKDHDYIYWNL
jgi:UDP-N-acetyl-D-galactosamine dehydrogenase